ncbi:MAG: 3-phosphoshikimate 1-carboxyvinyltransferase, partial [Acidobacteria bacterium]|nr:3-phosphoshikimate 1-carboxyvinyltransferase [Acidobacteriota bacterium]
FGVDVKWGSRIIEGRAVEAILIEPPIKLRAHDCNIAGDISSAAFFIAAAALLPDSDVTLDEVGLNHTRTEIVDTLQRLGADISVGDARVESNERRGELRVRGHGELVPTAGANVLGGALVTGLIDELPILCVVGTQIEGGLEIRDAAELRVKETDRISAMVKNLRALGAEVEEYPDGLRVAGRTPLSGARLEAYGDHRIAMACAVAALIAEGESELEGAESVAVSFPEFFTMLESVTER